MLNDLHNVSVMPLTFCSEWWSFDCRMDWISHIYRDKVHQLLCLICLLSSPIYGVQAVTPFFPCRWSALVQREASRWQQGGDNFSQRAKGLRLRILSIKNNQRPEQPNHHQRWKRRKGSGANPSGISLLLIKKIVRKCSPLLIKLQ